MHRNKVKNWLNQSQEEYDMSSCAVSELVNLTSLNQILDHVQSGHDYYPIKCNMLLNINERFTLRKLTSSLFSDLQLYTGENYIPKIIANAND